MRLAAFGARVAYGFCQSGSGRLLFDEAVIVFPRKSFKFLDCPDARCSEPVAKEGIPANKSALDRVGGQPQVRPVRAAGGDAALGIAAQPQSRV